MGSPGTGSKGPIPGFFLPDDKTRRTLRIRAAAGAPCQKTAIPSLCTARRRNRRVPSGHPGHRTPLHSEKPACVQRFFSRLKGGPVNASHIAGPTEVPRLPQNDAASRWPMILRIRPRHELRPINAPTTVQSFYPVPGKAYRMSLPPEEAKRITIILKLCTKKYYKKPLPAGYHRKE